MFTHVVLFWVKPDAPEGSTDRLLADCRAYLAKLPGLVFFDAGPPAMTPRDVVDNSYHVGLLTVFRDRAGHDAYQVHPLHQQFLTRNKPIFERVRVYDFAGE